MRLTAALAALALATVAAPACVHSAPAASQTSEKEAFGRLSVDEVQKLVDSNGALVVDNNSPERFQKGHVPGAINARYDAVTEEKLGADKDRTLIFYCANERCHACHKAANAAIALGYKKVFIMPAGIMGWEAAGKPVQN
jgi:rhodanese-related sulfurtransferase